LSREPATALKLYSVLRTYKIYQRYSGAERRWHVIRSRTHAWSRAGGKARKPPGGHGIRPASGPHAMEPTENREPRTDNWQPVFGYRACLLVPLFLPAVTGELVPLLDSSLLCW